MQKSSSPQQKIYSQIIFAKNVESAQYLMEELDYVQKEADYKAADLALQQAMDTYDWAVLGIADIE